MPGCIPLEIVAAIPCFRLSGEAVNMRRCLRSREKEGNVHDQCQVFFNHCKVLALLAKKLSFCNLCALAVELALHIFPTQC